MGSWNRSSCVCATWGRAAVLAAALVIVLGACGGCRPLKRLFKKTGEKGLTKNSSSLRFSGYKQTVSVKASPGELLKYLGDINNWYSLPGTQAGLGAEQSGGEEQTGPGTSFPYSVKKMGVEIKGRMIVVRTTDNELWLVWDNPQMIHVQKWSFEPDPEGTSLTLTLETAEPETAISEMMESTGMYNEVLVEVDRMLAGIQAHFDPSLDPDKLVSHGLRGENFDTIWQTYTVSAWANASLNDLARFNSHQTVDDQGKVLGLEGGGGCRPMNEVDYCPFASTLQTHRRLTYDTFWVGDLDTFLNTNTYASWMNYVSVFQVRAKNEVGGIRISETLLTEVPGGAGTNLMELMIGMSAIPDHLAESVLDKKAGAEAEAQK